jgi:glycerol-3-phosphate dehydrogenase
MIHGGLRYLAQGDLALVREAASERRIVQAIAPHLARQTPFVIPARSTGAIAKLRAGLWTFEKLGGVDKDHRHEVWSSAETHRREPAVRTDDLAGAVVYPEFLTDDARLTLANVRSAVASGALVASYAKVEALVVEGGVLRALEVADAFPGAPARRARLAARVVVNAAGPWVDEIRALEAAGTAPRLELTRGVHLVVPRAKAPVERTIILTAADRRGVFAVPRGEMAYLGTTDTFHPAVEAWPPVNGEDVDYLLAAAAQRLTSPPLVREDIVSTWSGLRPLVGQVGKSASEISRRDELWTGPAGMLSVAGGKLTAYRRMAERVVDAVVESLGVAAGACRTAEEPLVGGDAASDIRNVPGGPAGEAAHAVVVEGALTLEDYWVRRSARALFDPDGGLAALAPAADAMAPLLGWSETEKARQIDACKDIRARGMGFVQ